MNMKITNIAHLSQELTLKKILSDNEEKELKKLLTITFKGYRTVTPKINHTLNLLFMGEMLTNRKHFIYRFSYNQKKCTVVLSKTGSKSRTGDEIVNAFMKELRY